MPRHFPDEPPREYHVASPEFTRLLFIAFGTAALIGLICGVIWLAYLFLKNWLA